MYNLIKQRNIVETKGNTRVIDSNEKVEEIVKRNNASFTQGLFAPKIDISEDDDSEASEHVNGIEALVADASPEVISNATVSANQEAEVIIEKAKSDADQIIRNATDQAYKQAAAIADETRNAAKQEGLQQAQEELDQLRQQLTDEFEQMKNQQQQQYAMQMEEMEAELVGTILPVVENVLHVELEQYKEVIYALVKDAMLQFDSPKNISISISPDNYDFLKENLDSLQELVSSECSLELIKSEKLTEQQCKIETNSGIFDCGFDTQLKNLKKRILLLGGSEIS